MTMHHFRISPPFDPPVNFSPALPVPPRVLPRVPRRASMWGFLREAWRRHASRTRLAQLNDHLLKDIGLSRADAWREAAKPFWRP